MLMLLGDEYCGGASSNAEVGGFKSRLMCLHHKCESQHPAGTRHNNVGFSQKGSLVAEP